MATFIFVSLLASGGLVGVVLICIGLFWPQLIPQGEGLLNDTVQRWRGTMKQRLNQARQECEYWKERAARLETQLKAAGHSQPVQKTALNYINQLADEVLGGYGPLSAQARGCRVVFRQHESRVAPPNFHCVRG